MCKSKPLTVTYERCHELLEICEPSDFEKESGLKNKVNRNSKARAGEWAGSLEDQVTSSGEIYKVWRVKIDGKSYRVSRIIYFMVHGKDPYPFEIDHDNQDSRDNRVENIRLANEPGLQQQNIGLQINNKSGVKGVSEHQSGKWIAYIWDNKSKKNIYLGLFATRKEAAAARNEGVMKYFSEKTREANLIDLNSLPDCEAIPPKAD